MNFFFDFQLAWRSLFHEYDPSLIEWTTVCASQLVGFLVPGLVFFIVDLLQPAWARPWRKPAQFPTYLKLWKMVRCSTRNMLTGWVLHGVYLWWAYPRTLFVVESRLPTWKEAAGQYIGVFLLGEGLFYVSHKMMHENRWLYLKIHSIHHGTGVAPTGMSVWYGHIVDHFMFNGLPLALVTLVPAIVLQAHILVVEALSMLALLSGVVSHSGYYYRDKTVYDHWAHHENSSKNLGAYAVMDVLFNSYTGQSSCPLS